MEPLKPTESPGQVNLGGDAPLSRLVVPITLDHRYDRGTAIATRLAERWSLPLHLKPIRRSIPDMIDLTRDQADPVTDFAQGLEPGDLVVMGTNQPSTGPPTMSFAHALCHEWNGPIVMVGPNAELDASLDGDVVAALDSSSSAPQEVRTAAHLAAALGSSLRLVRVISSEPIAGATRPGPRRESASKAAYALDLTEQIDLRDVSWDEIHTDDAATALAEYVGLHDAAFLAIASPGMFALVRPRFGSIGMASVQAAPRPVIVTRPTDF